MCVYCLLLQVGWRFSVSYMRQDGGILSVARARLAVAGRVCVHCMLVDVGWRLSVSDIRQDGGYLSVI